MQTKVISNVVLNKLFYQISSELGFSEAVIESYLPDILALAKLWQQQGFVEVYQTKAERQWGRIKDSNSTVGSSPWFIGTYHARLIENENDPLLVIRFEGEKEETLSIRFLADHNDLFGCKAEKTYPQTLKKIKQRIFEFLNSGDR